MPPKRMEGGRDRRRKQEGEEGERGMEREKGEVERERGGGEGHREREGGSERNMHTIKKMSHDRQIDIIWRTKPQ